MDRPLRLAVLITNCEEDQNQFYLHALYSLDGVNELESNSVSVFPNPTNNRITVEGQGLNHVTVFNTMGQKVYEMSCQGESVDINLDNVVSILCRDPATRVRYGEDP